MLRDDIRAFMDDDGLVAHYRIRERPSHNASGNGVLYTSEYILTLYRRGEMNLMDRQTYRSTMKDCMIQNGLFKRGPHHSDQEGPDDYVGVTTASYFLELPFAEWVLHYGQRSRGRLSGLVEDRRERGVGWRLLYWLLDRIEVAWVYNNVTPGKLNRSSWLGRQPQLIAHFYYAAGEMPPLWRRIYWALAILFATRAKKEDLDAWILSWHLVVTMNRRCWIGTWAAHKWWKKLAEHFPDGMREVMGNYFSQDKDHPIARYFIS